jgi:serine/threonine protein kinase/tetratricopeptide (TPR) repeat protein
VSVTEPSGPTKNLTSSGIDRIDSAVSPSVDAHATLGAAAPVPTGIQSDRGTTAHKSIGRYQLLKKLGEGGMGQVWLAEQTTPVRREVALKLIKVGMYDDSVLQRFQSERQSLAIMNHPSIAKVFDAGTTPDGQPYFVMEYVPGSPITDYCDQKRLTIPERLELFIEVCEAVQHAHQKAIIHRDLKPANILVVEVDEKPMPRIIDFGLAKATTPQASGKAIFTQVGGWVGTPGYMSPEQTDPSVEDIDTRTDVYSLGVILYVLLTGFLPFEPKQWHKQPLYEVLRQLREDDPPSPSAKLSSEKESSSATAELRGAEPKQLTRLLHGDLDWITMKALEKDRARRYGAPSELAADIIRYLHNQPIMARPWSAGYRLQKYVRRHRIAVAAISGFLILLFGFAVMQFLQLRRITRERDRANRITGFMTNMFKVSDPSEARGNSITAREVLDKASNEISSGLVKDPEVQADLMYTMAATYKGLGLYSIAQALLEKAVDIQSRVLGRKDPKTLRSQSELASTLQMEGHFPEAEKLQRETLAIQQRVLGPEYPDTLETMNSLAKTLGEEGLYPEAEKLERETLDTRRRVLGPESADTLATVNGLARTLEDEGRYTEAEKLERDELEIQRRVHGSDHPYTLRSMRNLASALYYGGHYVEAEKMYREILDIERRVLGPEHPDTIGTMDNLGITLDDEHRYAEAEELQVQALDLCRRVRGPEHPETLAAMNNLAITLNDENRHSEAEKIYREALDVERRVLGLEHPDTLGTMNNLANTLQAEGHYAEAEKLERETLDDRRKVLGPEHPRTLSATNNLANTLRLEGRYTEAEKLSRETLEAQRRVLEPDQSGIEETVLTLARTLSVEGQFAQAEKLFREAIQIASKQDGQPDLPEVWFQFACGAAAAGRREEALEYLQRAIDHGYKDIESLAGDNDLNTLRGNPRFATLVAQAKEHDAELQKSN